MCRFFSDAVSVYHVKRTVSELNGTKLSRANTHTARLFWAKPKRSISAMREHCENCTVSSTGNCSRLTITATSYRQVYLACNTGYTENAPRRLGYIPHIRTSSGSHALYGHQPMKSAAAEREPLGL
jgi:hypothetical protein